MRHYLQGRHSRWTSIYPIYIDAKRPYKGSERRIAREKSVWWPLSSDMVDACGQLGLKTLHEVRRLIFSPYPTHR